MRVPSLAVAAAVALVTATSGIYLDILDYPHHLHYLQYLFISPQRGAQQRGGPRLQRAAADSMSGPRVRHLVPGK